VGSRNEFDLLFSARTNKGEGRVTLALEILREAEQMSARKTLKINRKCDILVSVLPLANRASSTYTCFHRSLTE